MSDALVTPSPPPAWRLLGVPLRRPDLRGWPVRLWLLGLGLLMLLAGWTWTTQWPGAETFESTRDPFVWGLYIQAFMFLVGISVGALVAFCLAVFSDAAWFRPLRRVALLQALAAMIAGMACILPDVGRPERLYWFVLDPNPASPFVLDAIVLNFYLLLTAVVLWALLSGRADLRWRRRLAAVALPTAVACIVVHGMIFGLVRGRDAWHSALLTPLFLSSAVVSGVAVLMLVGGVLHRLGRIRLDRSGLDALGRILAGAILVDAFLLGCELLVTYWPLSRTPGHTLHMDTILQGHHLLLFTAQVVAGVLLPLGLLWGSRSASARWPRLLAAALVTGGVFLKRSVILVMGFAVTPLGAQADYLPDAVEVLVTLGIFAVGLFVLTGGVLMFELGPAVGGTALVPMETEAPGPDNS